MAYALHLEAYFRPSRGFNVMSEFNVMAYLPHLFRNHTYISFKPKQKNLLGVLSRTIE